MAELDPDAVREAMVNAIAGALAGEMVTRWVLIAETIDENSARALWVQASPDAKAWDTLGLLQYGMHMELAALVQERGDGG